MTDWSKREAEQLKRSMQGKQVRDEKFVEKQGLKKKLGPRLWQQLDEQIRMSCDNFNREFGEGVLKLQARRNNSLTVSGNAEGRSAHLSVTFGNESGELRWQTHGSKENGAYDLVITDEGRAEFREVLTSHPSDIQAIAEDILSALVRRMREQP